MRLIRITKSLYANLAAIHLHVKQANPLLSGADFAVLELGEEPDCCIAENEKGLQVVVT